MWTRAGRSARKSAARPPAEMEPRQGRSSGAAYGFPYAHADATARWPLVYSEQPDRGFRHGLWDTLGFFSGRGFEIHDRNGDQTVKPLAATSLPSLAPAFCTRRKCLCRVKRQSEISFCCGLCPRAESVCTSLSLPGRYVPMPNSPLEVEFPVSPPMLVRMSPGRRCLPTHGRRFVPQARGRLMASRLGLVVPWQDGAGLGDVVKMIDSPAPKPGLGRSPATQQRSGPTGDSRAPPWLEGPEGVLPEAVPDTAPGRRGGMAGAGGGAGSPGASPALRRRPRPDRGRNPGPLRDPPPPGPPSGPRPGDNLPGSPGSAPSGRAAPARPRPDAT